MSLEHFPTAEPVDYAKWRQHICTGDLMLCSGSSSMSRIIQWATNSPWSHVAFVVRVDSIDRIMVVESVETIGVRTVRLSSYLSDYRGQGTPYPGGIVIARHADFSDHATRANLRRLGHVAVDLLGHPYDGNELAKIAARIMAAALEFPAGDRKLLKRDREFICSELVDELLRCVEIEIDHDGRGFISPRDIALDPRVSLQAVLKGII